ncbi:HigA family addiction module antidote protein [Variovorax sp. PAMC28562]|uniref:HigA family addiction module antitoxin n=1 Tax=Variovorax sp. PAMC28562 TaxID=2762323 RepID=UPI00164D7657|nr:HigA family addiction module antitoxin [Variovorax sp. PAMC28562]QNK72494.1 HigA family addiction module antidote protein [Variovorax sp. PAMC28562]
MTDKLIPLPTPGDILKAEFLDPMGITPYRLAKAIHVPQTRIAAIVKDGREITADTALRLSAFFGMSDAFFVNLQANYNAMQARAKLAAELATIERFVLAA